MHLAVTGSLSRPAGGGGGLFLRYFSESKDTIRQFFSSLLSSQSCKEMWKYARMEEGNLNIIASALHADTLAIVAGELVRLAGAQLKLDADSLPEAAGVVGCNP